METFKLIEKRDDNVSKITYLVKISEMAGGNSIRLLSTTEGLETGAVYIGSDIKETKRGWSFTSWWLTSRPVKIFLPREHFEKVEVK